MVSFLNEKGEPNIVDKVTILPPQSKMGTIEEEIRKDIINKSLFKGKYEEKIDNISAYEILKEKIENQKKEEEQALQEKEKQKLEKKSSTKKKKSKAEKAADKVTNSAMNTLGRKIGNSIFKGLFK